MRPCSTCSACSWMLLMLGCQMPNPAFDVGDDLADERGTDESGTSETGTSETGTSASSTETNSTETSTDGNETSTDGGPTCQDPESPCENGCANLTNDPLNCGECGMSCDGGQMCLNSNCVTTKRVFVSSIPYAASLNGVLGADELCKLLADAGQLDGEFKAWLSTANSSPAASFSKSAAYVLLDGTVVAKSWIDLTDGNLEAAINLDQNGSPIPAIEFCGATTAVWSGTAINGMFTAEPNCQNWMVGTVDLSGRVGDAGATNSTWTTMGDCTVHCAAPLPIYCFEQ